MGIRSFSILTIFLIVIFPLTSLAGDYSIKTGYDLYHNIQLLDNAEEPEDMLAGAKVAGYLDGYLDALVLMQTYYYNTLFPVNVMTEEEIKEVTKQFNFHHL